VFHGRAGAEYFWNAPFSDGVRWRGTLCCATPKWAVVTWVMRGPSNPFTGGPFKSNGVSILEIRKGAISRETTYWAVPGR